MPEMKLVNKSKSELGIALIYFSATEITQTIAGVIRDRLVEKGARTELFNVTPYAMRQRALPLEGFDSFIFGFPVFSDFAPQVINEWLPALNGRGRRCALFLTYGGRTTGYGHFHTMLLLENAGFEVLFTAEFLGRHSMNVGGWEMLPNRPDESDFAVARDYADLAIAKFSQDRPQVLRLQKPFQYPNAAEMLAQPSASPERRWTNPIRLAKTCSMCLRCATECPAAAFDAEAGLSDPVKCIECMHCVYICPDRSVAVDAGLRDYYPHFLSKWHLTEDMMQAKQSRIITDFRQAAS
jgi:ferredoxin